MLTKSRILCYEIVITAAFVKLFLEILIFYILILRQIYADHKNPFCIFDEWQFAVDEYSFFVPDLLLIIIQVSANEH